MAVHHDYHIGDKVLDTDNDIHNKLSYSTKEPYNIIQVYINGTVRVQKVLWLSKSTSFIASRTLKPINLGGGSAVGPVYPVLSRIN